MSERTEIDDLDERVYQTLNNGQQKRAGAITRELGFTLADIYKINQAIKRLLGDNRIDKINTSSYTYYKQK